MASTAAASLRVGVAVMTYYIFICVAQNEYFCAVERGSSTEHKFDKPFFIVWYNHAFMALVLPFVLGYLACWGASPAPPPGPPRVQSLDQQSQPLVPQQAARPGPGLRRIDWYLACHAVSWRQLLWTGSWAGFLFLAFNLLWFVGLPMPGMLPSTASAAANSAFAFVYLLSLPMLGERLDAVKGGAVLLCLGGVGCLAVSGAGGVLRPSVGILVEAACAAMQALYLVAFRRWAVRRGQLPPAMSALITGLEGLAHLLLFWPGFVLLDLTGLSPWRSPTAAQLRTLSAGAAMAASGNVALMAGLALLPSPLLVSVAALLQTPVQYVADLLLHPAAARALGWWEAAGGALVLLSFGLVLLRDRQLLARAEADGKAASAAAAAV